MYGFPHVPAQRASAVVGAPSRVPLAEVWLGGSAFPGKDLRRMRLGSDREGILKV